MQTDTDTPKQYKCQHCGSTSQGTPGTCCDQSRERMCECESGKMSKECCSKE